ncbi:MAG TPA: folylpolyglutamate synthase/dihydrofolate synthase family protein [Gemmatimonadaceae bacterium]|nr:folylpolyglutamate synthase/dihydrofolate synthase family protein [Gemmatimonadaceae bacterium]
MDDVLTSYRAAIESLFARTTGGIKPGLERTSELLARLGSPHKKLSAIHIAGTNGKGSVVATCESLLRWQGFRVGRYTSPHLIDFRERITVDGKPISEEDVLAFLERWIGAAEELGATFFEVTTALAFDWLAKQNVDIAVIETGLGGRLDSTNVLTPSVATVTSIGLDHTDLLGSTLEAIAREKAGIFKPGIPAIIGEPDAALQNFLADCALAAKASAIVVVDRDYSIEDVAVTALGTSFRLRTAGEEAAITTPLIGSYQARNTATAIATLSAIGDTYLPPFHELTLALARVFLPGRFQRQGKIIFDVAHNPAGAQTIAENLIALDPPHPRTALIAVLRDKDWRGIINALSPVIDRFMITNAPSAPPDRRWDVSEAHSYATSRGIAADLEPDLDIAIVRAQKRCGMLLVTGSFHTVGDVMSRLQVSPVAA